MTVRSGESVAMLLLQAATLLSICAAPDFVGQAYATKPLEYFVATSGSDAHSGTEQAPFRTLLRAQSEVRNQIAQGLKAPISVFIRVGTYELKDTLVFDARDSGTEACPIRYAAEPNEKVVISGGTVINDWTVQDDGHWTADLPDVRDEGWFFRQLVVNDQRAIRARWPNKDGQLHLETIGPDVQTFTFDQPLPSANLADQQTELVIYQNWSVTRGRVSHSGTNQLQTETPMGWIGHGPATTASTGKAVFLEHARHFIDQPGEWFLDRTAGVLHYLPLEGTNPEQTTTLVAVAPRLEQLIRIEGTAESPVRNLHFEGLRFEHTAFALPEVGYNEIQAAHYGTTRGEPTFVQSVAVECVYTEDSTFRGCRFAHLNASGIGLGAGCRRNSIQHCTIKDIGGNGIMIGWRGKGALAPGSAGKLDQDWEHLADAPHENTISNCRVRRCGADSFGGTGIWIAFSKNTHVLRNEIHDLPYTGISVGYRWNTSETSQSHCLVELNHIHNVMRKLADGGGIYTLGRQSGTKFQSNYIHDVHRSEFTHGEAPNNGFFIDQGSQGFAFEENVVHKTSGKPVRFNLSQRESHTWKQNYFGDQRAESIAAQQIIRRVLRETQP